MSSELEVGIALSMHRWSDTMDQRLQSREDALAKALERAEAQGARYDAITKELDIASS